MPGGTLKKRTAGGPGMVRAAARRESPPRRELPPSLRQSAVDGGVPESRGRGPNGYFLTCAISAVSRRT